MLKQKIRILIALTLGILLFTCGEKIVGRGDKTLTDMDGNVYNTIKIGNQIWTLENFRTTNYNDRSPIPNIAENIAWERDTTGAYCTYNNTTNSDSIAKFGLLYNWYVVNSGKLAPEGWRVPTDEDWSILEEYLIANNFNFDGTTTGNKIAKSLASKTDWDTLIENGAIGSILSHNNRSGFSAFPSGYRYTGRVVESNCEGIGRYTKWWTSSETNYLDVWIRELGVGNVDLGKGTTNCKICGFSVRLIKN